MATMDDALMGEAPIIPDASMTLDSMDDDLFGETAESLGMGVSLPTAPVPAALVLRLAEMQRIGCCTKLAWSNTGSIAQISEDGEKIIFRTLLRDRKRGSWKVSDVSKHEVVAPDGRHLVHIQWNGVGTDLAVADDHGAVRVYTIFGVVGRMHIGQGEFLNKDELLSSADAVVGMHWLPLWPNEFRSAYISPATKVGDKWVTRTKTGDIHANRARHPAENRGALLHLSRTGKLSLLYQNEVGFWQYTVAELHSSTPDAPLISHAAFADHGDTLILCTHDNAQNLWLYRTTINWNAVHHTKGNSSVTFVNPQIEIGRLATLENVAAQHSNTARLSHLRVVASPPDAAENGQLPTTVLAVFTHASLAVDGTLQHQDAHSIIARWVVESWTPTLHDSFAKMKANGSRALQGTNTLLMRQADRMPTKPVLTVDVQYFNTIVAFGASDGTIDFRDRATFDAIEPYGDMSVVSSLPRSGLEHNLGEHHLHVALSADGTVLGYMRLNGTFGISVMSPRYGWQVLDDGIGDSKSLVEMAMVCLARQYAIMTMSNAANDETLATLPHDLSPVMRVSFVKDTFQAVNRNPDISLLDHPKQQQMVFKDPCIPRILSAQMVLSTKPGSTQRTFAGQFAYVQLNLRLISMALAQTIIRGQEGKPDMLPSLAGLVKWATDLMVYIVDSIMPILQDPTAKDNVKPAFEQLVAETGSPALHLLLCSFSRTFLRFHTSYIALYLRSVQTARQRARTVKERQQLIDVYEMAKSLPITLTAFQELITEIDHSIRSTYTTANTSPERRMEIELAMLTEGHIPDEFLPVLQTLLDVSLPKAAEAADLGKLYFWDTEWLGISRGVPAEGAVRYDALRKTPLATDAKLRVCRRCGAEMEDVLAEPGKQPPLWLAHAQRQCFCLDFWWGAS